MSRVAIKFISGPVGVTHEWFLLHYKQALDQAISNWCEFIVGNAQGVDTFALEYLLSEKVDKSRITVYFYNPTSTEGLSQYMQMGVKIKSAFKSYTSRDKQMTHDSDADILQTLTSEEAKAMYGSNYNPRRRSGTQLNAERRILFNNQKNL